MILCIIQTCIMICFAPRTPVQLGCKRSLTYTFGNVNLVSCLQLILKSSSRVSLVLLKFSWAPKHATFQRFSYIHCIVMASLSPRCPSRIIWLLDEVPMWLQSSVGHYCKMLESLSASVLKDVSLKCGRRAVLSQKGQKKRGLSQKTCHLPPGRAFPKTKEN